MTDRQITIRRALDLLAQREVANRMLLREGVRINIPPLYVRFVNWSRNHPAKGTR